MSTGATTAEHKQCPYCGEQIKEVARKCRYCESYLDEELRRKELAGEHSAADRLLLPVGRAPSAIAAGYLGIFSLLPLFGILAAIAGFYALYVLKNRPELSGKGRAYFGIVMGFLTTGLYAWGILWASQH